MATTDGASADLSGSVCGLVVTRCWVEGCGNQAATKARGGALRPMYPMRNGDNDIIGHLCHAHYKRRLRHQRGKLLLVRWDDPELLRGISTVEAEEIARRRMLDWVDADDEESAFREVYRAFRRLSNVDKYKAHNAKRKAQNELRRAGRALPPAGGGGD